MWEPPDDDEVVFNTGWTPPETDEVVSGDSKQGMLSKVIPVANKIFEYTPPGLMLKGAQYAQKGLDIAGEKTAEKLGEMGVNPNVSAGIGTGIQMAPDIAMAASTLASPAMSLGKTAQKGMGRLGRIFARGGEKLVGIPEENTVAAFTKPSALFKAPTQNEVSQAYGKSELRSSGLADQLEQSLDDIIQKAKSTPRALVSRGSSQLRKYIDDGAASAKSIFQGRQGLDREIEALQSQINTAGGKNQSSSALLSAMKDKLNLRQTFNNALDKLAPKLREADALAAERFQISPFREFFLPGQANFISPKGIMRMVPGLPPIVGATVSGVGAVGKGISEAVSKSPRLLGVGASKFLKEKDLPREKAEEFLDEANGDKVLARKLAKQAGYKW